MRIALIFNPFSYVSHEENLRVVQKFFGLFPPLSLAWVASIAEKHGHQVIIIDAHALGLTKQETAKILKEFNPDILGFTINTYVYQETLSWVKFIKNVIQKPVIIGGVGVTLYPKESVMPKEIDFGFVKHVHESLPKFLNEFEGMKRFSDIPGLVYKDNGEIKLVPSSDSSFNFNELPNPARHLLQNEIYASFPTKRKNFTAMITSMGCPHRCIFCTVTRTPYSPRCSELVLKEIEECYYKHGIREIDFFDYELTIDRKRVIEICDGIIEKGMDLHWACRTRVDAVDSELLKKMKKSGCDRIYYGIESGVQEILDAIHKDITLEQVREAIALTKKTGIQPLGFFMIGNPGETKETIKKTLQFANSLNLNYIQFGRFNAKPATVIYADLMRSLNMDYWRDYMLGITEPRPLPRPWTKLTQEEIDKFTKAAYIKFHSRPLFLLKSVLEIKTLPELIRKILAFFEMLLYKDKVSRKPGSFTVYKDYRVSRIFKIWYKFIIRNRSI